MLSYQVLFCIINFVPCGKFEPPATMRAPLLTPVKAPPSPNLLGNSGSSLQLMTSWFGVAFALCPAMQIKTTKNNKIIQEYFIEQEEDSVQIAEVDLLDAETGYSIGERQLIL